MQNLKNDLTNWLAEQSINVTFYPKSYQLKFINNHAYQRIENYESMINVNWVQFFNQHSSKEYNPNSIAKFFELILYFNITNIKQNKNEGQKIFNLFKDDYKTFVPLAISYIKNVYLHNSFDPFTTFDFFQLSQDIKHHFFEAIAKTSLIKNINVKSTLFKIINETYDNPEQYLSELSLSPKSDIVVSTSTKNTFIFEVAMKDLFEYNLEKNYDDKTLYVLTTSMFNDVKNFEKQLGYEAFLSKYTTKNIKLFFVGDNLNIQLIESVLKEKLTQLLSFNLYEDIKDKFKPLSFEFIENIQLQLQIPEQNSVKKNKMKI
jgi:hypothetical protein